MTGRTIEFSLRPGESPWLADHSPHGTPVVAGAVLAEWLLGPHGGELWNLRFRRPLRVPPDGARVIRESEVHDGVESVRLIVPGHRSGGNGPAVVRAAEAERRALGKAGRAAGPLVGGGAVQTTADPTFHGPTFQVLGEPVRFGPAGLDAVLRAPGPGPDVAPWKSGRDVRLMDGLFQAAGLCRTRAGLDRGAPASAQSVRWGVADESSGSWTARVRWRDPDDPEGMNLWCVGADGRTVLEVGGYHAAPAKFIRWERSG